MAHRVKKSFIYRGNNYLAGDEFHVTEDRPWHSSLGEFVEEIVDPSTAKAIVAGTGDKTVAEVGQELASGARITTGEIEAATAPVVKADEGRRKRK